MRITDSHIEFMYQHDSGNGLETIKEHVQTCHPDYVEFLERKLRKNIKLNNTLMKERVPHLY